LNPNIFGLFEPKLGQKANKINFGNKNGKNAPDYDGNSIRHGQQLHAHSRTMLRYLRVILIVLFLTDFSSFSVS